MRKRLSADERRVQILEGAMCVFAVKGFTEASNKEIATAAGLRSPGLIYHYFPSKLDILKAIIDRHAPPVQLLQRAEELNALSPREVLTELALSYQDFYTTPASVALMRILLGEALRQPEFVPEFAAHGPLRVLGFLSAYLAKQMEAGKMKVRDPDLAALSFMGVLFAHALSRILTGQSFGGDKAPDLVVAHAVDTFLMGMEPDEQ